MHRKSNPRNWDQPPSSPLLHPRTGFWSLSESPLTTAWSFIPRSCMTGLAIDGFCQRRKRRTSSRNLAGREERPKIPYSLPKSGSDEKSGVTFLIGSAFVDWFSWCFLYVQNGYSSEMRNLKNRQILITQNCGDELKNACQKVFWQTNFHEIGRGSSHGQRRRINGSPGEKAPNRPLSNARYGLSSG